MEVIFTDPGLFHRLLAAVSIDLIDHLVPELPGGLPERVRAAPPHVDSGHNITPAELPDLLRDLLERVVTEELLSPFCRDLMAGSERLFIDGVSPYKGSSDMRLPLEHKRCVHDPGHGCYGKGSLYHLTIENDSKPSEIFVIFHM